MYILKKNISDSDLDNMQSRLSRRHGSRRVSTHRSRSSTTSAQPAQPDAPQPVAPSVPLASPVSTNISTSNKSLVVDAPIVVGKGLVSMEKLRQSYDAVVLGRGSSASPKISESAFPCFGRFLVCLVGHLPFAVGLPSRIFCCLSYAVLPLAATGLLAFATATSSGITSKWSFTMASTLCHLNNPCFSGMSFPTSWFCLLWIFFLQSPLFLYFHG